MIKKNIFGPVPRIFILFAALYFPAATGHAQNIAFSGKINWNGTETVRISETDSFSLISFEGSSTMPDEFGTLPVFVKRFPLQDGYTVSEVTLRNLKFSAFAPGEIPGTKDAGRIGSELRILRSVETERRKNFVMVCFMPVRINGTTGVYEKLVSFDLDISCAQVPGNYGARSAGKYADHSVLSAGTWFKLTVSTPGLYKISKSDLQSMGVATGSLDPRNIRIFGNGGGMLPEANAVPRADDLTENSIFVYGENDGQFNDGDYILFYGKPADSWSYNSSDRLFHHTKNVYSDQNYYFLTIDNGPGKRVRFREPVQQPSTGVIDRFNDYAFYEKDDINLIKSGREWYDREIFDITTTRTYAFSFPNLDNTQPAVIKADLAARSTSGSTSFTISAGEVALMNIPVASTSGDWLAEYGKRGAKTGTFTASGNSIELEVKFNKNGHEATGYLNYLELNVTRMLRMSGPQMAFRSTVATEKDKVYEYRLGADGQQLTIWDITSLSDISLINPSQSGGNYVFRLVSDSSVHEYLAFDGSAFNTISSYARIGNQDLHGAGSYDYVIVTHPDFMSQAEKLAEFHREHDNFTVLVTTPELIYNEFSSGAQDITAIRDFMKMMYDKSGTARTPKYLLLFGDASYDYKDRVQNNTNFIPSYQSPESLDPVDSYVTDDYYVLLDENEGQAAGGALDMGVGRFIVQTAAEADAAVAKIEHYCSNNDTIKKDWRNVVSFVAEDWDNNLHLNQTEDLTGIIEQNHKDFNVDKIYLDAYQAESTPGGLRNPDVNDAINKRMAKGALIMNYTGHGGELGWAHERVLEIPDVKSWTNFNNMPAFMTATCEFSRFDDPAFISAGEWVFLNPAGGGIALFTTTRATFAGSNAALSHNFYNKVFVKINGQFPKMGDLILEAKNATGGSANSRKFVLLGDPALQLAYPEETVVTTSINNKIITNVPDTLRALAEVTISGEIRNDAGTLIPDFNGTVFPTIYDKASEVTTLGNTGGPVTKFSLRKNIIYKGKVAVSAGKFTFTFIVPKDIAYQYGIGKISYYARNGETDANGYEDNFIVGGYDNGAITDNEGPEIRLYMNNTSFVQGGITDQDPNLLAVINDESGLNVVGNGIGHDMTAILDDDSQNPKILNDYYVSDINTFKSGTVLYPYSGLADGHHSIRLKAWDVYNNSSEATIDFIVASSANAALEKVMNYPNPFRYSTTFSFECNQSPAPLDVEIRIYSFNGNLVRTINQQIYADGYRSNDIVWDGTSDCGSAIGTGMYVYSLSVRLPDGSVVEKTSKLVVLR